MAILLEAATGSQRSIPGISRSRRITSGRSVYGQPATLLAVLRCENLEIGDPIKARLEHVEVVVIMFDVEHFGHVAVSILSPATLVTSSFDHLVTRTNISDSRNGIYGIFARQFRISPA